MRSLVMMSFLILAFLCSLASAQTAGPNDVLVINNRLFVNGIEFVIKGTDYSPTPLGINGMSTSGATYGYGGNGFCSTKVTPYNESKSACFDSDYFDGSPWYQAPTVQGFKPVWERDFPNMVKYGVNTIRLYNTNPTTLAASKLYTNLFAKPTGKDHTQFMDFCSQYNFRVIFPLYFYDPDFSSLDPVKYRRFLRWQIDEVGGHPALLMFQLGNEQGWTWDSGQYQNAAVQQKFNDYVTFIKRYTYSKHNRIIATTFAVQYWDYFMYFCTTTFSVDIFSLNIFAGDATNQDFNAVYRLFKLNGYTTSKFPEGMTKAQCDGDKAFLISEFGPTYTNNVKYNTGELNTFYATIVNSMSAGIIGSVFFEHTDEGGNKIFGAYTISTSYANGKNSGQPDFFVPDTVTRTQKATDLESGTINGIPYNMNADVFSNFLKRSPYTSTNVPDMCMAVSNSYQKCPGNYPWRCSGNGRCNRLNGQCTCNTGWSGSDCSVATCPSSCSNNGKCSDYVSPPECFCNPGNNYYGSACASYWNPSTTGSCPNACTNGNGVCNTATGRCACWTGWTGLDCAVHDLKGLGSTTTSVLATTSSSTFTLTSTASTLAASSSASTSSTSTTAAASVFAATIAASSTSSVSVTSTASTSTTASTLAASSTASTSATIATTSTASTSATSSTAATLAASSSASTVSVSSSASTVGITVSASNQAASTSTVATSTSATTSATLQASSSTSVTSVATTTGFASTSATSASSTTTKVASTTVASTLAALSGSNAQAATSTLSTTNTVASSTSAVSVSLTGRVSSTSSASSSVATTVAASTSLGVTTSSTTGLQSLTSSSTAETSVAASTTAETVALATSTSSASTTGTVESSTSSAVVASISSTSQATTSTASSASTTTATVQSTSTASAQSTSSATVQSTSTATRSTTASTVSSTGIVTTASSSTGALNQTTATVASTVATIGTSSSTTGSKPTEWLVNLMVVIPGDSDCVDPLNLAVVLRQLFKITPKVVVTPNVNNQTYFHVNATFVATNTTIFQNAANVVMHSSIVDNVIVNCGPSVISATTSVSVKPDASPIIVSNSAPSLRSVSCLKCLASMIVFALLLVL